LVKFILPKSILISIAILGLTSLKADLGHAQNKILFLRLRFHNNSITLVQSNVRPGVLKQSADFLKSGGIEYQCQTAAGQLLLSSLMNDPSIQRYEFEDPEHPRTLRMKEVKLTDVEFTLRIPFKEDIRRVEFFRVEPQGTSSLMRKTARTCIGAIEIPAGAGGQ
jgi:hypothetical protein